MVFVGLIIGSSQNPYFFKAPEESSFSLPEQNSVDKGLLPIHEDHLSLEKALDILLCKGEDLFLIKQALDFISKETGQKIKYTEEAVLLVDVTYLSPQTEELLKCISQLDSEKRKGLSLNLSTNRFMSVDNLKQFLTAYGKEADSLYLTNDKINDQSFEELILHCVNINHLYISCEQITNLDVLTKIPRLTSLTCINCLSLLSLPELPRLTTLSCSWCAFIKKLPTLPALKTLNCSGCQSLRELPELPSLKALNCYACTSLQTIPVFPASHRLTATSALILNRCRSFPSSKNFAAAIAALLKLYQIFLP